MMLGSKGILPPADDPVALDQACADLCLAAEPIRNSQLGDHLARLNWKLRNDLRRAGAFMSLV